MKIIIFNCLLCCLCFNASAQTAADIISRHLNARGGTALDSIKNAKMELEMSFKNAPGMKGKATYYITMMQSHRVDMSMPKMYDIIICISGNQGWSVLTQGWGGAAKDKKPEVERIDSAEVQGLKHQTEILGPMFGYKEKGYKAEYVGIEKVNDIDTYNVKITASNNTVYNCYIDTVSYAEVKMSMTTPGSPNTPAVHFYYSNLKPVQGVMMPFSIEMHNRKGIMYFDFSDIQLNTLIDEKLFEIPPGE